MRNVNSDCFMGNDILSMDVINENSRKNNSLHSIETGLVAFAGTIIHFKFEFSAKA